MLIKLRKAQSTAEYAVVLGAIVAFALGMQVYLKRGLQARVKSGVDAFTQPAYTFTEETTGITASFDSAAQYEPYYQEASYDTYQASKKDINVDDEFSTNITGNEISARAGYQKQRGVRDTDTLWGLGD
jgi:gas vesicle protein